VSAEPRLLERAGRRLAARTTRRSFLTRVGRGFLAVAGGAVVASTLAPERAEAHHICAHTYTTGSCPHPYAPLSRTDRYGYPVHPIFGYPVDDQGDLYVSRSAPRHRTCQEWVPTKFTFVHRPQYGGGWSRCCNNRIRHIQDCCSYSRIRINGDGSVRGYCYGGRRVFCITYQEFNVRC
jgi:hypothetical protein